MAVGTTASLISPSPQTTIEMSVAHLCQGIYPPLLRSHCALPVCRDKISSKRCQVPRVAELDATVWIEPLKDLFQKDNIIEHVTMFVYCFVCKNFSTTKSHVHPCVQAMSFHVRNHFYDLLSAAVRFFLTTHPQM